jgi:hypothetical protein
MWLEIVCVMRQNLDQVWQALVSMMTHHVLYGIGPNPRLPLVIVDSIHNGALIYSREPDFIVRAPSMGLREFILSDIGVDVWALFLV